MALRDSDPAEVGGYRIEDRLGSGGMGVVYLARSASGRRLAVKVVHGQYADDDEFRTRFSREVAAARQVSGAFTAPVVDADADAPRPWMATLYIPGDDLGTHVRRHGPLPRPELRELAAGLTEALRDIHRAGVVHRDLKPANVMLADDGPRVIDFGISRAAEFAAADVLTQTGRVMGTPPFMSPEQFSSPHDVGPAADIFSLGAVLVYAATRHGPFDSESPYETATKVVEGEPRLDDVPEDLLPFIRLCLEKHPKSRPTPDDLLRLLRDGRIPDPRPVPEDEQTQRVRPPGRRRRLWLASAAGAVVLAAVVATTVATSGGDAAPDDLPAGWQAWHRQAKAPAGTPALSRGGGGSFSDCTAMDAFLVCAGDDVMAARFSLADGRNTWTRMVDPTDNQSSSSGRGAVIGTRRDRVYVYGADDRDLGTSGSTTTRYTVQALAPGTGKVLWKTVTGDGDGAADPDSVNGSSTAIPEGVVTQYGNQGNSFALLGAADGKVRWKVPLPRRADGCVVRSPAGRVYLICQTGTGSESTARTSVAQLDAATGRAHWTVSTKGMMDVYGQDAGHLVLVEDNVTRRAVTLIDVSSHVLTTVRLSRTEPSDATPALVRGILCFTLPSGDVRAVAPHTGGQLWQSNSTVEEPGPPTASATRLYLASPSGRLAALDLRTGRVEATVPGRDDGGGADFTSAGAPLVLIGDALYIPYGIRSVYTVDVGKL